MAKLTPAEQQKAIEAAFRKLPIARPTDPEKLSYESLIPSIPRQLLVERGNVRLRDMGDVAVAEMWRYIDAHKRHEELASSSTTKREIASLARHARALFGAIDSLHKPAIDALNYRKEALTGPLGIRTKLKVLIAAADSATVPELPANAGRGRRPHVQARKIAFEVAKHFYALTDKLPTVRTLEGKAYGPFIDLLGDVFAALEIRDAVENHAREVCKVMKENQRKQTN